MIDHISFGVSNCAKSAAFYDRALEPLGISRLFEDMSGAIKTAGYGQAPRPEFWIAEHGSAPGKLHVALAASSREAVDAFHHEALAAGGTDNGAPGYRFYHSGYYGAYVLDPDGHNIEAVFHDPSKA
jgi:catechol 2,3-dioxygenase-like lactoylglutathione lyase family enzyme